MGVLMINDGYLMVTIKNKDHLTVDNDQQHKGMYWSMMVSSGSILIDHPQGCHICGDLPSNIIKYGELTSMDLPLTIGIAVQLGQ